MFKNIKKHITKNNSIFYLGIIFFFALFLFPLLLQAESRVHGKAWWGDDLAYVYFDCTEYQLNSILDDPENFNDLPYPRGFHFDSETCAIDQHVNIDNNGNFYGSAFNFAKGLINFGGSSTPVVVPDDYSFNVNCPNLCDSSNYCSACYNAEEQRVYGWAQVADTSQELIKLDTTLGLNENYLQIKNWNLSSSTEPFYSELPSGYFIGHASSTIGGIRIPLSFNCISEDGKNDENEECDLRDYAVYIENPQIGNMTAPNWSFEDACNPGRARGASLRWTLSSGSHDGYEIVVMNNPDLVVSTSTLSSNVICWSGEVSGTATQYNIPNSSDQKCTDFSDISYNAEYTWHIRLRYFNGTNHEWTDWYQFGVNDGHEGEVFDIDNSHESVADRDKRTFSTYLHEFPVPYFFWYPEEILIAEEETNIFNALDPLQKSYVFSSASPNTPVSCDEYMSCAYEWSTSDPASVIETPTAATTSIEFWTPGNTSVDLRLSDSDGYYCTRTRLIENINYGLPIWREVKPE